MRKKVMCLILTVCIVIGMISIPTFAGGGNVTVDKVIEVPEKGLCIVNGTYYGISKKWYDSVNPDKEVLSLSVGIPENVVVVANDALRDSWSSEKERRGAVVDYDGGGVYTDKYHIVKLDFSDATGLTTINNQAALNCSEISGVLDLSNTKVETLGKSAFSGCTGITGVILPTTLKNIGSEESGSVFRGCTGMEYVRTAGGDADAVFELPETLQTIGRQSFYGCTGFPDNTSVTIPSSVTYVGSEAFYYADPITDIFVETDDASSYDGAAFKGNSRSGYGLGKRLIIFKDSASKKTFKPSGLSSYKNAVTYEFLLYYGEEGGTAVKVEPKLYGQAVNVCKSNGEWYADADYTMPEAESGSAPTGYGVGWAYNGKLLTVNTVLKPDGDELYLDVQHVLLNPTIEFIVDGEVISTEGTNPKINLSNDKEHQIGVKVSHPIETADDADVKVKFEYKWTDVWKGGSEGPRMSESGFGRYNQFDNPGVSNTIPINGAAHERTADDDYSGIDYGDGYYLVEIYGYYCPKSGGQWQLFYKSASTVIGADPERTVNTAYLFYVITSDPAEAPAVVMEDLSVGYGYTDAVLKALVTEQAGHTYAYQWYEAAAEGQTENGEKLEGATGNSYSVPVGKNAGVYYYYLEISAKKSENGDTAIAKIPVKLCVEPKTIIVIPSHGQNKYFGQTDPTFTYALSGDDSGVDVTGSLGREPGESLGEYKYTIGTLTTNNSNYVLKLSDLSDTFMIERYNMEALFSPEVPDGEDGWYQSSVTITPPAGHSLSVDGGKTWGTNPVTIDGFSGDFGYLLRSEKDDDTNGAIAVNSKNLDIDTVFPVIQGISDGETYCIQIEFRVQDTNLKNVLVNGEAISSHNGVYTLNAGEYTVAAFDMAGNCVIVSITVNASHIPGELIVDKEPSCTQSGSGHRNCTCCGETVESDVGILPLGHKFGDWEIIVSPNCTESGSRERVCDVCGYTDTEPLQAEGHSWEDEYTVDKAATCTEDGSMSIHCEKCDAKKDVQLIPASGHVPSGEWQRDESEHWKDCEVCGIEVDRETHTFEWVVDKEATESEAGIKHEECIVCAYEKPPVEIPPLDNGETSSDESESGETETPPTGDNAHVSFWLMLLGVVGFVVTIITKSKRALGR